MRTKVDPALIERSGPEAPWLKVAFAEQGVTEYHGLAANNPRILEYISSFPNLAHIKQMVDGSENSQEGGFRLQDERG